MSDRIEPDQRYATRPLSGGSDLAKRIRLLVLQDSPGFGGHEIMFLRPQSASIYPLKDRVEGADGPAVMAAALPVGEPIAALLDGLPVQNHVRLAGRLIIDDSENLDARYPCPLRREPQYSFVE